MPITDEAIDLIVSWCAEHLIEPVCTQGESVVIQHRRINGLIFCSTADELCEQSYPMTNCDECEAIHVKVAKRLSAKTQREWDRQKHLAIRDIWVKGRSS